MLRRRLSLLQAVSLNMSMMVGIGPFITIPTILAMGVMLAITALAYRRIEVAGRLMVVLWGGMLVTVAWVIAAGLARFDAARAFDLPAGALTLDRPFWLGLGAVLGLAMYNYL